MRIEKLKLGTVARPRSAIVMIAATLLICGSVSEASAKSRHHHHKHHHHSHHRHHAANPALMDANASLPSLFQLPGVQTPGQVEAQAPARTFVPSSGGRSFSGMASFYGNEAGNRTASGQRFNQGAMTAAHRSLPFGTKLRVTHGDRSVVVTINDRGPFIRGRVLDLSKGAASAIGLTSRGVGRVVAEVM
ncbi:septal ring lytic transglycosylase RlpA family protein [Tardiphaga sp.]|uniref:septal ring lytic transglycosylase RlpA family protein n=1 Tax=Tardiphaga sp. TaxID=1926292 RepID=UPI0025E58EF5|nr:septal ring lytic transglycosylase RlpA family protein [Tardiphaga sp.]